ncbi:MAG: NADH-quinone oxidoreductase subunit L [Candidatus Riflebacteria bacterium]|nr:NADH-quinone oxidoreductase subunit L [Candidatus Riflebacteria bacterium]
MITSHIIIGIFTPIVGAFMLPLFSKISELVRNVAALLFVLVSFICSLLLIKEASGSVFPTIQSSWLIGETIFKADMLAVFMALVSSSIGSIIIVYSFGYINEYSHRNEYYFLVVLFLGAMMGLIYSNNLIITYIFWEVTAFACWRLIGFFRKDFQVRKADKAFLITMAGSLIMLIGFFILFQQTGTFDISEIHERLKNSGPSSLAVLLILFGIFSKSATFPMHTWLPDAGVAPSPVTALLHAAVLVKIGVYVYVRIFVGSMAIPEIWHTIIPIMACISMLISAGAALLETDIKRIIAYSTVSQVAYIFLGLSTGNEIGIMGGLLFILMHGISKGGLFLCAGIVEHATHTKDITKMGGLAYEMPVTAVSFILCAFSVMGLPPFGGFFSKYMVISGAVKSGQLVISALFILGALMTMMYLLRLFNLVFLGEKAQSGIHEGTPGMVGSVAFLAVLSLVSGILVQLPASLANAAVQQISAGVFK